MESIQQPSKTGAPVTHHENTFVPIDFNPFPGLGSPHIQTILACFAPGGLSPPSKAMIVPLNDGDALSCEVSTPSTWKPTDPTIILIHGLGGCHSASYMVRFGRKLYLAGYRVLRLNMRSCGSGRGLAKLPYHGGLSSDVLQVVKVLKQGHPDSPITLVGYSLGGNIALKLASELGEAGSSIVEQTIAVCPPVNLAETAEIMARPVNHLYNRYYMHHLANFTKEWTQGQSFSTIYEFDQIVTAPQWGFSSPAAYYQDSSSCNRLTKIKHPCHILLAADDPFINFRSCTESARSASVKVWLSDHGGHMGFFGWPDKEHGYYWLDKLLLQWVSERV